MEKTYLKKCDCCGKEAECVVVSSSADGKGEPRLVCEDCNHLTK